MNKALERASNDLLVGFPKDRSILYQKSKCLIKAGHCRNRSGNAPFLHKILTKQIQPLVRGSKQFIRMLSNLHKEKDRKVGTKKKGIVVLGVLHYPRLKIALSKATG